MPPLPPGTRYLRHPDLVSADMDGETVMMSLERGEYFGIGGVGTRIWDLLAQPVSIDEICRIIGDEYEVDAATCRRDVAAFLEQLVESGAATPA